MYLTRIEVRHLRNLTSVSLSPAKRLNIIEGRNASGKTSLLEAIHLLGLARSFRSLRTSNIVQHAEDSLLVFSEFTIGPQVHRLGLQRFTDNRLLIRLDGNNLQRRAELASLLPLQLITPDSISLLTGSPKERRQYLDWLMFHVEPSFHQIWATYVRALKQRNALLRQRCTPDDAATWDKALVTAGESLDVLRKKTLDQLTPLVRHYADLLLPGSTISVGYRQGWKAEIGLGEALTAAIEQDSKNRYTSVGPHRADLAFRHEGKMVADHFSRGQLKLLVCALRLAQLGYLQNKTNKSSLVLIDDLPAELDAPHRRLLLQQLHKLDNQVFITATDRVDLDYSEWEEVKVFHVEHGEIEEVV